MTDPTDKVSAIQHYSSESNVKPEDTQGLLEKVNGFIKATGGHFSLVITPAAVECRYVHPTGVQTSVGDSFAAPSDAVSDVMTRAQTILKEIQDWDFAQAAKESMIAQQAGKLQ